MNNKVLKFLDDIKAYKDGNRWFIPWKISFNRKVHFQGRNGWFQSIGLAIFQVKDEDVINIQPITTREKVGNCMIEIPLEEIDNLIEILKNLKNGNTL